MNTDQHNFIDIIKKALSTSDDPTLKADAISEITTLKSNNPTINTEELIDYIEEFSFEWINFDREDGANGFARDHILKIQQILNDIGNGNEYSRVFKAELAYSRLIGGMYEYRIILRDMAAQTYEEIAEEKMNIRQNEPKTHPEEPDFTLEDVRVKVNIIDQTGNKVIEDKFVLN